MLIGFSLEEINLGLGRFKYLIEVENLALLQLEECGALKLLTLLDTAAFWLRLAILVNTSFEFCLNVGILLTLVDSSVGAVKAVLVETSFEFQSTLRFEFQSILCLSFSLM